MTNKIKRFILLAYGRSGSTLLVNYLNSHGNILCYHEPFNQNWWQDTIKLYGNLPSAINEIYDVKNVLINLSNNKLLGIHKLYEMFYSKSPPNFKKLSSLKIKSIGFKVTVAQAFSDVPNLWNCLMQDKNLIIILLRRHNLLERYVSYQLARKSGVWHSSIPYHNENPMLYIEFDDFRTFIDQFLLEEEILKKEITHSSLPWLQIYYEDLIHSKATTLRNTFSFLGVKPQTVVNNGMFKLNHMEPKRQITNFHELAILARGSIYEEYLK